MSTEQTWETKSTSSAVTEKLGERLGKRLKGHEVIELVSDLGGGKTTFVRGIVRGVGSSDKVASPTFTISKIYKTDKLELHHFDFYRLEESGLIEHELADILDDPLVITIIEWGGLVQHVLPSERVTITFSKVSESGRKIIVSYPTSYSYLVEDL